MHYSLRCMELQMLKEYLLGGPRPSFHYPSALESFKRQFAHLENGGAAPRGERAQQGRGGEGTQLNSGRRFWGPKGRGQECRKSGARAEGSGRRAGRRAAWRW